MKEGRTETLLTKGLGFHNNRQFSEARKCYEEVLSQDPAHAKALRLIGGLLLGEGKPRNALDFLLRSIRADDSSPLVFNDLGLCQSQLGEKGKALDYFDLAIELDAQFHEAWNNGGNALLGLNQFDPAADYFKAAIRLKNDFGEAFLGLGIACEGMDRNSLAEECYRKAAELKPTLNESWLNLSALCFNDQQLEEAKKALRASIQFCGKTTRALTGLAEVLIKEGEHQAARELLEQALEFQPTDKGFWANYAYALEQTDDHEGALSSFGRYIDSIKQESSAGNIASLKYALGCMSLKYGKLTEGWELIEHRWHSGSQIFLPRHPLEKMWAGQNLENKTLLMVDEQGFGDVIQFSRYITLLTGRCGNIVFQCQQQLISLFRASNIDCTVIANNESPPKFDYYIPVMSFPRIFETTMETIPHQVPYMRGASQPTHPLPPAKGVMRVGIAWAGNKSHRHNEQRCINFEVLKPLLDLPKIDLYSLQLGFNCERGNLIQCLSDGGDFLDTATIIERLDLVLSVDTSVAHLAGAMGKKTWLMLPKPPEWRWFIEGETSPWYPTMRLFRQDAPGDWVAVIARVKEALIREQQGRLSGLD